MDDFYVFGDVHNYVATAQRFLDKYKPNKVIWLGDFMDNFHDGPDEAERTGNFMRKIVEERSNDVFLLSNHDVCYKFSETLNKKYHLRKPTWGFSVPKLKALNFAFPREYWKKFRIFHKEQYNGKYVLFSHAGLHLGMFRNREFREPRIWIEEKFALENGNSPRELAWLDNALGPLWMRWPLPIIDGVCQVVGHTPRSGPDVILSEDDQTWNMNFDCAKNFAGYFCDEGVFAVGVDNNKRVQLI